MKTYILSRLIQFPLILATIGFTFFGEALRDALDPKLSGRRMP